MELRVLGPVEAYDGDESLPVGGPKQRAVLALLIANAGRPISLEKILDAVYGDSPADGARRSVQTYISTIRRSLGDIVRREASGYVLAAGGATIDAVQFEERASAAMAKIDTDPQAASAMLREALAMWRGHAYADVDGGPLLQAEITRLSELRLSALEARVEADLAAGRHNELVGELEALTVEHPLRERFRAQHMLALYRCGRQTEALRAYERTRLYLAEEIGVDPSPELHRLEHQILDHDPNLELPSLPSISQRAMLVVQVADAATLIRVDPTERATLVETLATAMDGAVARHGGDGLAQRGVALYAAFPAVGPAVAAASEILASRELAGDGHTRIAVDFGDVEIVDTGEVSGPPVRRVAGLVAAAHPRQALLSADAHRALTADGDSGWVVKSLGSHTIRGLDAPSPIFQLVFPGQEADFPPLLVDTVPPPLPSDRRSLAGYELRQPLSSGLTGTTFRAYQPSVGREVAVTVVDSAWANEPRFVSRFEVEAQLVSRLHHPHLVPVLDYWRDASGAYLVAPSVAGSRLSDALHVGTLDSETRLRLLGQVGGVLSYAHQFGVVHGAVSPDTVVLDESANGYLTGVGFVLRLVGAPRVRSSYSPPEEDRGGRITASADVYGLGVLASELLGGQQLLDGLDQSRQPPPERIVSVIERATASRAEDRFASIDDLLVALAEAIGTTDAPRRLTSTRNPYKGLGAFGEADADDFFGRSRAVQVLATMLASRRLVAVVGPSGSGKSSLVRAGLVPAVRDGVLDEAAQWVVADMFPGSHPFEELESALARVAVEGPGSLMGELDRDPRGLLRVIKRILPRDTGLLLVIDQFEELFTLTRDETVRDRFLQALVEVASSERSGTRVVITLRADFFDRPLELPEYGELLNESMYAITVPTSDELAQAIRRPAEALGVAWEPGLVDQIVADITGAPGMLPLLQYALTQVFESRTADELTHDSYRSVGGVVGALASHADGLFEQLEPPRQRLARQLFLRLVGVHPSGEPTRRRARLPELNSIGDPGDVDAVLTAYGEARLVTFDRDPVTRSPTVEVAHEALLSRWPRLAEWIAAAREDLLLHRRLVDAVEEWSLHERDDGYLLAGGRLAHFQAWAATSGLTLTQTETEYLELSGRRADEQERRRRRLRSLVTAGLAAASLISGFFWLRADRSAEIARSRELAASAVDALDRDPELSLLLALEAADIADPPVEATASIHESLASHRKILTYTWPEDQDLRQDLSTGLSPDGQLLVASSGSPYIEVVDVDTGARLWSRAFPDGAIARALFTADGSAVVATVGWSGSDGTVTPDEALRSELGIQLLDARTGAKIRRLDLGSCGVVTRPNLVSAVGSPSKPFLLTPIGQDADCSVSGAGPGDRWPDISLVDLITGEVERLSDHPQSVYLTPDARFLLIGDSGDADIPFTSSSRVVDRNSGTELAEIPGWPVAISHNGQVAVTMIGDSETERLELAVWNLDSPNPSDPLTKIVDFVALQPRGVLAWLAPDGTTVSTVGTGEGVRLWDVHGDVERVPVLTGLGSDDKLSYSADGSRLAVSEFFGANSVVFDFRAPAEVATVQLCSQIAPPTGAVEMRGDTISVRASCDDSATLGTQFLIDSASYHLRATVEDQSALRGALSPDGGLFAAQIGRRPNIVSQIALRETSDGAVVATLDGLCEWEDGGEMGPDCVAFPDTPFPEWPWALAFSSDGGLLAMAGQNTDAVVVWDTTTRQIVAKATVEHNTAGPDQVLDVAFSPGGDRLAASFVWRPKELWMLSTENWSALSQYEAPADAATNEAPSHNLTFTPDGQTLIATDFSIFGEGRITFMDGTTLEHLDEISDAHDGGVSQLAISRDGTRLASAGLDGFVKVWDVATRSLVHQIAVAPANVVGVAFLEGGRRLAVTSAPEGELRIVTLDRAELLEIARSRVTRSFTDTECATYRIEPCPTLSDLRAR